MMGGGGRMDIMQAMGFGVDGFDEHFGGIAKRNFIHELEGDQKEVCLGLYCELNNRQGDTQIKAKIMLRDNIVRSRLNFDFPMTPVVHYSNG